MWLRARAPGLPRSLRGRSRSDVFPRRRPGPASSASGAYGGEHVGDAAILGGVLLRMHRDHGTERAVVVSSRPHRTARWVDCLQLPIPVEVISNSRAARARAVACADAVVHAGGPVMDLPELLIEHLETSEMARKAGISFAFEGIGVGPFRLRPSEATARFLLNAADHVTVRSTTRRRAPSPGWSKGRRHSRSCL